MCEEEKAIQPETSDNILMLKSHLKEDSLAYKLVSSFASKVDDNQDTTSTLLDRLDEIKEEYAIPSTEEN